MITGSVAVRDQSISRRSHLCQSRVVAMLAEWVSLTKQEQGIDKEDGIRDDDGPARKRPLRPFVRNHTR
jgi:hypothetical protein